MDQRSGIDDQELSQHMLKTIEQQIEYLKKHNGGITSLNYFYEVFKKLYSNWIKELKFQKENGKKIIGIFCNFIPKELILASNSIFIRLCMGSSEPILCSEGIVPRNFCPLIKSSLGSSIMRSPLFELLDVIIIPTTCDGMKKLVEILVESKRTWVMEVPHTNETPQARQLWLIEVQILKKKLEELTRTKITTKEFKVDGVIYHTLQGCHIYGLEQYRIEMALNNINIPILSIETDYSKEDVEQIRTRLEAFIEMISNRKLKSNIDPAVTNSSIKTKI